MIGVRHFTDKDNRGNRRIGNGGKKAGHPDHDKGTGLGNDTGHDLMENFADRPAHGAADDNRGAKDPTAAAGAYRKRGGQYFPDRQK